VWKENLSSVLQAQSATVSTCLLSHWHHDHIGGLADFLELCPEAKVYKNKPNLDPDEILNGQDVRDMSDGQTFSIGEGTDRFTIQAFHCPGHTADHMAFTVTESSDGDQGAMFTGDNVLGHGTAVFEDLVAYLDSLRLMSDRIGDGARAYPAHGAVLENGKATIEMYVKHRQQREDEALRVLRTGSVDEVSNEEPSVEDAAREWNSMEMVKIMYKDVPENLHVPAEGGLLQVLRKLEGEGKVEKSDSGRWRLKQKAAL
jgi:glyoxylase-like metal-dependent hydrolase (beta-lactamase superfamily II)